MALHAAYVPVRNLLGDGVRFDVADVFAGGAMTSLATLVVFTAAGGRDGPTGWSRRLPATVGTAAAGVVLVLVLAPPALAHDPGQGEDAGAVALRMSIDSDRASVTVDLPAGVCGSTQPRALESWLPISSGSGAQTVSATERYAYFPPATSDDTVKLAGSVLLYGAMLGLLYATFVLVPSSRRHGPAPAPATRR